MIPTILCPIDFSDANRGALRYGAAVAQHFGGRLLLLAVEDPLLTEAVGLSTGIAWDPGDTRRSLASFAHKVFSTGTPPSVTLDYRVEVGNPAREILRVAEEEHCDLIAMSTRGLTGMRKMFFGSTTERVLRETAVPVLATPPEDPGPLSVSTHARSLVKRLLLPVDLSPQSLHQLQVARGIAEALDVPLVAMHVVEPVRSALAERTPLPHVEMERRARAEEGLGHLLATLPRRLHAESLVAFGDPAEEIVKLARDRQAGLVVIGLHASPMRGVRMGSVTYRVLCLAPTLVLALPPMTVMASSGHAHAHEARHRLAGAAGAA